MKYFSSVVILLLIFSCQSFGEIANKLWNQTNVDRLKGDLLKDYDVSSRPENQKETTTCHLGITIINMELDETKGILETHAWMRLNWTDSKVKWDPKQYDNIDKIRVSADEVWAPDVSIYNAAEPNLVEHLAKSNKILYHNGKVLWVPTAKFKTYCKMDLKLWPFDQQTCEIKVGSWTFDAFQLNLLVQKDAAVDTQYYHSLEWEIKSVDAKRNEKFYPCCPEPYVDITFELVFSRRSPTFKAIAIVPAIVVVIMTLVSFWLPPNAGEKIFINAMACILVCVLLMYISQLLPIMASTAPLLVTFYSHTLYLLGVSFIISVLVINISRNQKCANIPELTRKIFLEGFIGRNLSGKQIDAIKENQVEAPLVENNKNNEEHNNIKIPIELKDSISPRNDWIRVAVAIDRIAFIIYLIIFILMGFYHFV